MSDLYATLTALIVDNWEMLDALAVAVGLVIYVVASHTLHQRRHPSAAIAWVLGILLVPLCGFAALSRFRPVASWCCLVRRPTCAAPSRRQSMVRRRALSN